MSTKDVGAIARITSRWATAPPTVSTQVEEEYDFLAPQYDDLVAEWKYDAPAVAAGLALKHLRRDSEILDAGCGTGLVGAALSKAGFTDVIGVDISARSLERAAERAVYAQVVRGNLQVPLAWPNHSFDAVVCIGVLTYLQHRSPLDEFCRVTRPGGYIIFTQRADFYLNGDRDDYRRRETEGRWKSVFVSAPQPYLPLHADFSNHIEVIYFVFQVAAQA